MSDSVEHDDGGYQIVQRDDDRAPWAVVECRVCGYVMRPPVSKDAPCYKRHTIPEAPCANCGLTPAHVKKWVLPKSRLEELGLE